MKILIENPPVYDSIIDHGMRPNERTVYTYGDTLYNPNNLIIPDDLMRHEETHSEQQGNDPDAWWGRYLIDPYFRISQEVEAYANQYDFMCQKIKDRNQRSKILLNISQILSSPVYGNMIGQSDAYQIIKNKAKTK